MHWPQRRRRKGSGAEEASDLTQSGAGAESACCKHRAVLGAGQSPRRVIQKFDICPEAAGPSLLNGMVYLAPEAKKMPMNVGLDHGRGRPAHNIERWVERRSSGVVAS
jgi:hypothetical protein